MRRDQLWAMATLSCVAGVISCGGLGDEPQERKAWALSMHQTQAPKDKGCFTADYPSTEWREVACVTPPNIPMPPRQTAFAIGSGNGDVSAGAPSGTITQTIGSFENVVNVTSESGPIGNTGPSIANAYSLQINTNFMTTGTGCAGSPNTTDCQTWEQWIYENDGSTGFAHTQYWILRYNTTCPDATWNQFSFTGDPDIYCWKNSVGGAVVPNQVITNIDNWTFSGSATGTGDLVIMNTGATAFMANGDNAVNASSGWTIAEFNLVGDGGNSAGGGQASFNAGASVNVRTQITHSGGTAAPTCVAQSFTAETNNLNFGPTAPASTTPGPAIIFQQSTAGGATSACAASATIGDTHLRTFNGLFYDFQAFGDFVLAETTVEDFPDPGIFAGPGPSSGSPGAMVPSPGGSRAQTRFVVQARQVNGAPTWPDVSVNQAVATQMGNTKVAICLPGRLVVNGATTDLADGGSLSLASETVRVTRTGNSYLIRSASGDSVHAVLNPTWIDADVGLGLVPSNAKGLLVNANGNVNQIAARDGTVLTAPFAFDQLYGAFADSWRVPANASLLSVCSGDAAETGIPSRTFYAADLNLRDRLRARAICLAAGVKEKSLLDPCTLDVAVLGRKAAKVYVDAIPPAAVGLIVMKHPPRPPCRDIHHRHRGHSHHHDGGCGCSH